MDYFGNLLPNHHQHQQHIPPHIPRATGPLRQQPPARLTLAAPYPVAVPEISTRLIGATKPLNSELGTPSSTDTSMDLGSSVSVLFSVNPPSPVESELCSDEQEAIVRTWCTSGPSTEQLLGEDHVQPFCDTQDDSATTSAGASAAVTGGDDNSESSISGKRGTRGPRRGSSESNKKAELYKTELCISVHSGLVCKYGDNCQFAHSVAELQHVNRHPRYKTQLCTSYQSHGFCKYNERCTFIHRPEEARVPLSPSLFHKTLAQAQLSSPNPNQPERLTVPTHVPNQIHTQVLSQLPHQMLAQMLNQNNQNIQHQARNALLSSSSHPNSGTATPVQQLAGYSKMDRVRAISDPCISTYMDRTRGLQQLSRMDGIEHDLFYEEPMGKNMSMAMGMVNPTTAEYTHHVSATPMPNDPNEFMHQGPQQQAMPLSVRRQRRMGICYPPPGFLTDGGHPAQHRDIFDLLPHYNEHGMFDPVRPPWMTPSSIWQPLNHNLTPGNNNNSATDVNVKQGQAQDQSSQSQSQSQAIPGPPQQGTSVDAECDAEWIAKLGRYITTSLNDFEM
ncbi:hypothetical protein BGZ96_002829 [Linnemannia gamsii]|uniref:C3H1-type domain-containing protein n=1 Tax=Linnemannia gamsii TaxID=64522 RepID=A0ABQ7JK76_9FUNG|nr:hypothetical protein BGZ96_002829 [Linnemannia gamsii]